MLEDLMAQSRPRQLTYTRNLLSKKFPAHHQDFTRAFPRVLCLYIFSFLDPRSLCRCAQVTSLFYLDRLRRASFRSVGIGSSCRKPIRSGCLNAFDSVGHRNKVPQPTKARSGNVSIHSISKHCKQCLSEYEVQKGSLPVSDRYERF